MVKRLIPAAVAVGWPSVAAACPYCFGQAGDAYVIATVVLLALPVLLIGGLYITLQRASAQRSKLLETEQRGTR